MSNRQKVPEGSTTAKAIDYSLKRRALTRFIDDADLAADNNRIENRIRPVALVRKNWLFAGILRACQCAAAAIMSLLHTAMLNGNEPYAYLKDVMRRLPTQPASALRDLLPYRWTPLV